MSIKDANTRYVAVKLLYDALGQALKDEKADHIAALMDSAAETGSKKWSVQIGDVEVASVSLVEKSESIVLSDPEALANHRGAASPSEVMLTMKDWAAKQALALVVHVDEEGNGFTKDGELVGPGFAIKPPGAPYQSVRWSTKNDGREVMGAALKSGELAAVLTGLPLLEQ